MPQNYTPVGMEIEMADINSGAPAAAEPEAVDYKALSDSLKAERDALSGKVNELLGETKAAKSAKREAEAQANAQAKAKAEAEGNYQQLFQSSEKERDTLAAQLKELSGTIAKKEITNAAMRISAKLADGENAELLSEFVARRLKFAEGDIKVTDSNGNLTVSSLDDLAREFEGSARYAALIRGKQSTGGGATGGANGSGAAKTMTRSNFEALTPLKRVEFSKAGGKVTNT